MSCKCSEYETCDVCVGAFSVGAFSVRKSTRTVTGPRGKDATSRGSHYVARDGSGLETIQVVEAFKLNFNLANAVTYILRADAKGQRGSDLQKAVDYLWRELYGEWPTHPVKEIIK